jgi:hypothetical protein
MASLPTFRDVRFTLRILFSVNILTLSLSFSNALLADSVKRFVLKAGSLGWRHVSRGFQRASRTVANTQRVTAAKVTLERVPLRVQWNRAEWTGIYTRPTPYTGLIDNTHDTCLFIPDHGPWNGAGRETGGFDTVATNDRIKEPKLVKHHDL